MYIPKDYAIINDVVIEEFVKTNSFGLLLSSGNESVPMATHLPFLIEKRRGKYFLKTHLAKINPHCSFLNNKETLVIFSGPHAYISASWYKNSQNVPTWNYTSVHMKGICNEINGGENISKLLKDTVSNYENGNIRHHESLSHEYLQALEEHVRAFEIEIHHIDAKFKLSQNKPKEDIIAVIQELSKNSHNTELVSMMKSANKNKLA